jgi:hypothetical protein
MFDVVVADAAGTAPPEALTALDAAIAQDPDDARRYWAVGEQLPALGRHVTAQYVGQRAASTSVTSRRRLQKPAPTEPVDQRAVSGPPRARSG